MSRGRQKRVEKAQERRVESKKKKVRREIKSFYKALVQNQLFPLLEKVNGVAGKVQGEGDADADALHIWVDAPPSSRVSKDGADGDYYNDDDEIENQNSKKDKKQKSKGGNKKSHPRSSLESAGDEKGPADDPTMSRDQFFHGGNGNQGGLKNNKSKKSGLPLKHNHFAAKEITLAEAIKPKNGKLHSFYDEGTCAKVLKRASNEAAKSQIKLDDTGGSNGMDPDKVEYIDMLYHMKIPLCATSAEKKDLNVSELMSKTLVSEKVPISGVAYATYRNVLLFDRFDGGKVVDDETELKLFTVVEPDDIVNKGGSTQEECDNIINLSGPVLELVATFLPDEYFGILPSICKTFYSEIGKSSPSLWKYLLQRYNWPAALEEFHGGDENVTLAYKNLFINHYSVCRRVKGLANGIYHLFTTQAETDVDCKNCVVKNFVANPYSREHCISNVLFWDESSVLTTSRNDCYLRLHHVSEQNSKDVCKQILELRVAPVPISKRVSCSLLSVAVDDRYMACSYEVDDEDIVTTMMKDNLLANSAEESISSGEYLQPNNLSTCFLDFRDLNFSNDRFHYFHHPLIANPEDRSNIHTRIIGGIHACGHGVFCVLIKLYHFDEEVDFESQELFTCMMSFSASKGRDFIIDLERIPDDIARSNPIICSNYRRKKRIEPTEFVCTSSRTSETFLSAVGRTGIFQDSRHLSQGLVSTENFLGFEQPLDVDEIDHSSVIIANGRNLVATSYLLNLSSNGENASKHVAISTQTIGLSNDIGLSPRSILLRNNYSKILSLKLMEDDYLVIVCAGDTDDIAYADQFENWDVYGLDEFEASKRLDLVVIHIPSMKELYSFTVQSPKTLDRVFIDSTLIDITKTRALVAAFWYMGLCITGAVKSNKGDVKQHKTKKVKTKKRLVAKTGKGGKRQGTGLVKL